MKITVIGAGAIGGNLARTLAAAGHEVQVADARGPEAVAPEVLETGARVIAPETAVQGRDAIILSIPFDRVPELADLLASVPEDTMIVETSNYYPHLNGRIEAVEQGLAESVRNAEALGRPVIKAWNAALAAPPAPHHHRADA